MIKKLKRIVEDNCISKDGNSSTLDYWSDVVFARCVFLLAPFSLLAIIPAIIICLQTESYLILWYDVFSLLMLLFVGYTPGINVKVRKIILILLLFLTAFVLLSELGNSGPGLAYLLCGTLFSLLLFPGKKTFAPFALTLAFCIVYGVLFYFNYVEIETIHNNNLMEWIANSSNVLFMSAVFSLIIPFFFSKLEGILEEKNLLLESVSNTNSELNKSIEEVKSKNLELEQFAYVASHDLQEPLRMITSFMDKLNQKYKDQLDPKAQQYINFATDGAIRMKAIILDLLEYSRAGKFLEAKENIDLLQIVENYQILRRKVLDEKAAEIIIGHLPEVLSYRASISQTLHCLLDNAIHYSKEGQAPKISISASELEDFWEIQIADNGIGIDAQFHEKIFEIFQRLHNRDQYEGTGIGLSIVKKNVESWGGKIRIQSSAGNGSIFYFTIPKNTL